MSLRYTLIATVLLALSASNCSNPFSEIKEIERRLSKLEDTLEEQRRELLERLDAIEVTPENYQEIADIRQRLQEPGLTNADIAELRSRVERLERSYLDWSEVTSQLSDKVYLVLWGLWSTESYEIGAAATAFAVDGTTLLTNAHVVISFRELDGHVEGVNKARSTTDVSPVWIVVRNGTTEMHYKSNYYIIREAGIHKDYDEVEYGPDVGYLKIKEGWIYSTVILASNDEVYRLRQGQRIATLGFPGELLGLYIEEQYPTDATFKEGTISAIRPFWSCPVDTSIYNRYIIQHNLDLSNGTSGSPIYNLSGKVIAVNSGAINSESALGVAIRIDKARELLSRAAKPALVAKIPKEKAFIEMLEGRDIRTLKWSNVKTILKKLADTKVE